MIDLCPCRHYIWSLKYTREIITDAESSYFKRTKEVSFWRKKYLRILGSWVFYNTFVIVYYIDHVLQTWFLLMLLFILHNNPEKKMIIFLILHELELLNGNFLMYKWRNFQLKYGWHQNSDTLNSGVFSLVILIFNSVHIVLRFSQKPRNLYLVPDLGGKGH